MLVTLDWIHYHYYKFNKEYFGDLLPCIDFKISRSKNTWGYAKYRFDYPNNTIIPESITISNYYDSPEEVKINTLLHEMIHIADYTFNPHHFIRNHKKVSGRTYDAHGEWFQAEAKRIEKYGWTISKYITTKEQKISKLSERSKKCLARKKDIALVGVIYGTSGMNFYFKTDIYKVKDVKALIKTYNFFYIGDVKKLEFYTFEDDKLITKRSCGKKLRGWFLNNEKMSKKLESLKATKIKI